MLSEDGTLGSTNLFGILSIPTPLAFLLSNLGSYVPGGGTSPEKKFIYYLQHRKQSGQGHLLKLKDVMTKTHLIINQ